VVTQQIMWLVDEELLGWCYTGCTELLLHKLMLLLQCAWNCEGRKSDGSALEVGHRSQNKDPLPRTDLSLLLVVAPPRLPDQKIMFACTRSLLSQQCLSCHRGSEQANNQFPWSEALPRRGASGATAPSAVGEAGASPLCPKQIGASAPRRAPSLPQP